MIVTCVADVLPTCTVAGSPDQKQKVQLRTALFVIVTTALLLLHYDLSAQTINYS